MSTIKSSDEHLTLNADGTSKDIKFQANGVEKASISSAGVIATNGASLDGAVTINESGADVDFRVESDTKVNAFTVNGATGRVGVNRGTDPDARLEVSAANETALAVTATVSGEYGVIVTSGSTNATPIMDLRDTNNASHLKVLADGRGLSEFTAKAWVSFNGDSTIVIKDSHNVSSITDNGTGHYSINFANNMANANYVASGMSGIGHFMTNLNAAQAVGNITVYTTDHAGNNNDKPYNYLMVIGA